MRILTDNKNMKNSTKKDQKKNKKTSKNKKKINWLPIIIIVACFAVGLGLGFGIKYAVKKAKAKNLDVAFYQLPEEMKSELEKRINEGYNGKIKIVDLTDETFDARKIARKYDLFFSWNGSAVTKLERYAEDFPVEWYGNMPSSLRRHAGKTLPIILDHYELSYYREGRINAGLNFPQNIVELQAYLEKMKSYVFSPFFCAGANDDTLLALVGALVEAFGGTKSYNLMIDNFRKKPSLTQTIDLQLSTTGNKEDEFTIRSVLDLLRGWQENGLTHPNWFTAKQGDVDAFLEDNQVAVLFTSLSTHRNMKYRLVSKLDADRVPAFSAKINHGLIAPSIVAVKLTDVDYFDSILIDLVTEASQKDLSNITKLGPVTSRGQAYDRQADDVRFLAASCVDGPLPPLGLATNQTNKDAKHKLAEEIRYYLKSGATTGLITR